jgi:hypothetical protein
VELDRIDDEISRINSSLSKMLGKRKQAQSVSKAIVLRKDEYKEWLGQEPTFPKPIARFLSDGSYHRDSSDEDLTEPETVTLIRNSAGTQPSAGSWARKPDTIAGLVGQLSQVEQQTPRLKLLT